MQENTFNILREISKAHPLAVLELTHTHTHTLSHTQSAALTHSAWLRGRTLAPCRSATQMEKHSEHNFPSRVKKITKGKNK